MFLASRPKTPLRVFCIAAFEYFERLRGRTLGSTRRQAMAYACDFGSLRDDYYDQQRLNVAEYRSLRRDLRRLAPDATTSRYIQQLRQAERTRPALTSGTPGVSDAVLAYRTSVLALILRWLQEISASRIDPLKLDALLQLASLMQLADDVLDWRDDQAARRPSYVTAFLLDLPPADVARRLRAEAAALLERAVGAARQDTGAAPFAAAAALTWTFIVVLLKVQFRP
jgi:hypothetical protein